MQMYRDHKVPGTLFIVGGMDGSGKSTQLSLLELVACLLKKEEGRALEPYHRQCRLDSRLLLSMGQSESKGRGLFYYQWSGSRFKLIHKLVGKD